MPTLERAAPDAQFCHKHLCFLLDCARSWGCAVQGAHVETYPPLSNLIVF